MICVQSELRNFLILCMLHRWKKEALQTLFICSFIFNCPSSQHPRSSTTLDGKTTQSPTRELSLLNLTSCFLVPMTTNSVIPSFNWSLSESIHCLVSTLHLSMVSTATEWSSQELVLKDTYNCVSSAYVLVFGRWRSMVVKSLLTYRTERRGPRQDPCGTPYFTSNQRDVPPLTEIWHGDMTWTRSEHVLKCQSLYIVDQAI